MKVYCDRCKGNTNHEIIKEYSYEYTQDNSPDMQIDFANGTWQIIRCNGCEQISFRERWVTSEDYNPNTGELEESVNLYPKRGEHLLTTKYFFNVPRKLKRVYSEIIDCFNNNINTFCAAGLRAIIEGICATEGIVDGPIETPMKDGSVTIRRRKDLQGKIEGLHEKGIITKSHSEILHEHRFLGNKAVHELDIPSKEELKLAIEIVEHTLENIYELKDKAEELRWKKQRRK